MDILYELRSERDRIDAAIRTLSGGNVRNGRRRYARTAGIQAAPTNGRRVRRKLSAAARRKISEAAKARWAKAKRAGKTSL